MLLNIVIATLLISLISFVGILFSSKIIRKFMHYFISFAAATLIAVALLDLIPHALMELHDKGVHLHESTFFIAVGIILFFLVERFIHWHHCGKEACHEKPAGILILTGDFVHNFIDGLLIAGAFLLDMSSGILMAVMVLVHEIPQEFGDFTILLHSGYTKTKALLLNFVSALSAVVGGIVGFFAFEMAKGIAPYAVLIAAGGFLYVALSDIIPSLHEHKRKKVVIEALIFVLTLVGFYFLLGVVHSH